MIYHEKFVCAIKVNGKVLRETKDLVKLPFGSEFSVLIKNLNSRRAEFTLHIDGQDVLDGTKILVDANDETEIKRYIRNGNMNEGNAFKFIERTQSIEDGPRGIKVDDGVIRVEYWFEQEKPIEKIIHHKDYYYNDYYGPYYWPYYPHYRNYPYYNHTFGGGLVYTNNSNGSILGGSSPTYNMATAEAHGSGGSSMGGSKEFLTGGTSTSGVATGGMSKGMGGIIRSQGMNAVNSCNSSFTSSDTSQLNNLSAIPMNAGIDSVSSKEFTNDIGITVPGSNVKQQFHTVYGFNPETVSNVIILRLVGTIGSVKIKEAITVKHKQKCSTCGKVNKATSKFCTSCGTSLELV